jgi:hypothetical protein
MMGAIIAGPGPFRNYLAHGVITRVSHRVVLGGMVFPASFRWEDADTGTPNTRFAIW